MQKRIGILCMACIVTLLTGCAEGNQDMTAGNMLTVRKDGTVVESITGGFDRAYYGEEDLKEFVMEEIAAYNRTKEADSIQVDKLSVKENIATIQLTYKTSDDYQSFTAYTFFCGTIAEAYHAGYNLNVTLQSTGEEPSIDRKEILEMSDNHIVIVNAALDIKLPDRILYVSDNVSVKGGKQAAVESKELAYIIY